MVWSYLTFSWVVRFSECTLSDLKDLLLVTEILLASEGEVVFFLRHVVAFFLTYPAVLGFIDNYYILESHTILLI